LDEQSKDTHMGGYIHKILSHEAVTRRSTQRRLRKPGALAPTHSFEDLNSPGGDLKPYRRSRGAVVGVPPPRVKGVFDDGCKFCPPSDAPYRSIRKASRGARPSEQLSMPLGDQRLGVSDTDDQPSRIYPAPWKLSPFQGAHREFL
jgi:hypothetical protein